MSKNVRKVTISRDLRRKLNTEKEILQKTGDPTIDKKKIFELVISERTK